MKRFFKYALITLVLLIAVLMAIPFFLNVNDYKPLIVKQVKQATGREIDFGEIKASLFPWVGVSIDRVRMSNASGFSDQPFLKAVNIDVQVAFMPLLHREVVIERFVIDAPEVILERNSSGVFNWDDLTAGKQTSTTPGPGNGKPVPSPSQQAEGPPGAFKLEALTAKALRLHGGKITWIDGLSGTRMSVTELNVDVEDVQRTRPVQFKVSMQIEGNKMALDGQLGPLADVESFQPGSLPLQLHLKSDALTLSTFKPYLPKAAIAYMDALLSIDVNLEQRSSKDRLSTGTLTLAGEHRLGISWRLQMPKPTALEIRSVKLSLDGSDMLDIKGSLHGLGGKFGYDLQAKSSEISRKMVGEWLPEIPKMYGEHPDPWKYVKLSLMASGSATHIELRDVQLLMDGELVQVSGRIGFAGQPDIDLRLASNSLHLDPWIPAGSKSPAAEGTVKKTPSSTGAAATTSAPEPDLRFLSGWKVNADIKIDKLFAQGQELDNLKILMAGKNGVITVDPLRFDYGKGNMRNKTRLEVRKYPVVWSATTSATGVQIRPILKTLADMGSLYGVLEMSSQLTGSGLAEPRLTSNLNGQGNIMIRDGKIEGIDIPGAVRRATQLGKKGGDTQSTDFSQLSGSFVIKNGVVRNDDLSMASPVFRLTGNGIINLANKTLDYHAKPKLVGTLVGQGDTDAARKGLAVPVRIRGPLNAPKVSLDVSLKTLLQDPQALKDQVKGVKSLLKGGGGTKDLGKQLKKGLGGLLQGL